MVGECDSSDNENVDYLSFSMHDDSGIANHIGVPEVDGQHAQGHEGSNGNHNDVCQYLQPMPISCRQSSAKTAARAKAKANTASSRQKVKKSQANTPGTCKSLFGGAPCHRTTEQHHMVTSRMREAKAAKRARNAVAAADDDMEQMLDAVQQHSACRRGHFVTGGRKFTVARKSKRRRDKLLLGVRGESSTGHRVPISFSGLAAICRNDEALNARQLARTYRVSNRTIVRLQRSGAHMYMSIQLAAVQRIQETTTTRRPFFFISSLSFDETSQSLALPLLLPVRDAHAHNLAHTVRALWKVLVSRQSFAFGFGGAGETAIMHVVRPCVPMLGTSAESLMAALFHHQQFRHLTELEEQQFEAAHIAVVHYDADGASSNLKMLAVRMALLPEHVLASFWHCGNHRNQMIDAALTNCDDGKLLG